MSIRYQDGNFTQLEQQSSQEHQKPPTIPITASEVADILKGFSPVAQCYPEDLYRFTMSPPEAEQAGIADCTVRRGDQPFIARLCLRDRKNDGPEWIASEHDNWTYNHHHDTPSRSSVELSIYLGDPHTPLTNRYPPAQAEFIRNPHEALFPLGKPPTRDDLIDWVIKWKEIAEQENPIFPGALSLGHIPELAQYVMDQYEALAKKHGYEQLSAVPTWPHTPKFFLKNGYRYQREEDKLAMERLSAVQQHMKLSPALTSWVTLLQFAVEYALVQNISLEDIGISANRVMTDGRGLVTYPLTPGRNLWMVKDLIPQRDVVE